MNSLFSLFWSGLFGHHLLFTYALILPVVFQYSSDLKTLWRYGLGLSVFIPVSTFCASILFGMFFRPHAFGWLGLPYFNFGFLNYFVYLLVIFYLAERVPLFLKGYERQYVFLQPIVDGLNFFLDGFMGRFITFGVILLVDYFVWPVHYAVSFALGASLGVWLTLLLVWCVMQSLTRLDAVKTLPDFVLKMGILGGIGLLFSVF